MFADETGCTLNQVRRWRWIFSRWPKQHRRDDVSLYVHGILAAISEPEARFANMAEPPLIKRTGQRRWTQDAACRVVGWQVDRLETVQETVDAVHELVGDEKVASQLAADLLRRPEVTFQATADTTVADRVAAAQELVRDEEVASRIAADIGEAMTVRPATPDDSSAVLQLAEDFYAEDGFTTTRAQLAQHLHHLLNSAAAHVAVIDDEATVVAFAVTTTSYGLKSGLSAELEDLYVTPAARRRGLAQQLINDSTQWASSLGATQLEIVIAPNGLDVQHLRDYYQTRGFRDEGRQLLTQPLTTDDTPKP